MKIRTNEISSFVINKTHEYEDDGDLAYEAEVTITRMNGTTFDVTLAYLREGTLQDLRILRKDLAIEILVDVLSEQ